MTIDPIRNFAKVTVSTGYDSLATTIVLNSGDGNKIPNPSTEGAFNLTWWNFTSYPDPSDDPYVEIVRVTSKTGDTITVSREQEGTLPSDKNIANKTYKMILAPTKKLVDDLNVLISPITPGSILFATADDKITEDSTNLFWDNVNNRLGVGTSLPDAKLDVNGIIRTTSFASIPTIGVGIEFFYDNVTTNQGYIQAYDRSLSQYRPLQLEGSSIVLNNNSGGNVGIGTISPTEKLDVIGNIAVSGTVDGVDISAHVAATANVHGITDTSALLTQDMKDVANGIASLDSNGNLLANGASLILKRDGSNNVSIKERTSSEYPAYFNRVGTNDYDGYINESGVFKQVQTAGMKDVANGITALDGSGYILAPGPGISLTRGGAGNVTIFERTSGEAIIYFNRAGSNDFRGYIYENNVAKRILTEASLPFTAMSQPARSLGTVYQNTSGKPMLVAVSMNNASGAFGYAYIGPSSPSMTVCKDGNAGTTSSGTLTFAVPNNWYYQVTGTAIVTWTEWV